MKNVFKKIFAATTSLLLSFGFISIPSVSALENTDYVEALKNDPNTYETTFTEEQFVESLEKQGFIVEKKRTDVKTRGLERASYYTVKKPLKQNAAPLNSGKVPGNHFIDTTFKTVNGWKYFVTFNGAGIELLSSPYGKENQSSTWEQRNGGQGVYWRTLVQYTYSSSHSISLSGGWFSVGAGSTYVYRTNLVTEESTFNFPIMQ